MIYGRRSIGRYANTATVMCIVFLICMIAAPAATQSGRNTRNYYAGNQATANGALAALGGKAYLTSESSENEILRFIENSLLSNRIVQNYSRTILRIIDSLFPFVGFSLLLCRFGHFIRKRSQKISLLAINIGGHAPPYCIGIRDAIINHVKGTKE